MSVPSVFLRENDRECWRFLPEGLRYLLREFETVHVIPEGNSLTGFFPDLQCLSAAFLDPEFSLRSGVYVGSFLNVAGCAVERIAGDNDQFTVNYSVWARK